MLKATSIVTEQNPSHCTYTITLNYDLRHRRRFLMQTDEGVEFLLDLPIPVVLKHDDVLELSDHSLVKVQAANEDVLDICTNNSETLLGVAWSLGNMHKPVEILPSLIRIRYDRLLEEEMSHLHVTLKRHSAPFTPNANMHLHAHEHHPKNGSLETAN